MARVSEDNRLAVRAPVDQKLITQLCAKWVEKNPRRRKIALKQFERALSLVCKRHDKTPYTHHQFVASLMTNLQILKEPGTYPDGNSKEALRKYYLIKLLAAEHYKPVVLSRDRGNFSDTQRKHVWKQIKLSISRDFREGQISKNTLPHDHLRVLVDKCCNDVVLSMRLGIVV